MIYQMRKAYKGGWRAGADTHSKDEPTCPYHPVLNFILFMVWNHGLHDGAAYALYKLATAPVRHAFILTRPIPINHPIDWVEKAIEDM